MFDIGPEKLLFVITIALAVLGPERIPHVARGLGKARSEIRRLTSGMHPDALHALSNPREALLNAVAEPRRAITEVATAPRLALADAIDNFQFAGSTAAPSPRDAEPVAPFAITGIAPPDDPSFN